MRIPALAPFGAIFRTELLLSSKRVAPYATAAVCCANAVLWWGWGPARARGLAVNSEHVIAGMLPVFSFMTLPLFTAVLMCDPVIRDFRANVTPLIFSKPLSRASYLLGKFFGNFFVLVCCQAAFPVTFCVLQAVRRPGMIVLEPRFLPYLKHFVILIVVSHLLLAAFYFALGAITRNAKIVYALAVAFYPVYITYHMALLNSLPMRWRVALDPLLMDWQREATRGLPPALIDRLPVVYNADVIANRALVILLAAACLALLHARFAKSARRGEADRGHFSLLDLSSGVGGGLRTDTAGALSALDTRRADANEPAGAALRESEEAIVREVAATVGEGAAVPLRGASSLLEKSSPLREKSSPPLLLEKSSLPRVSLAGSGLRAGLAKLRAALAVEFRLLASERSLVVFAPLAVSLSLLESAFYPVTPAPTYSAAYAVGAAHTLLLFILGAVVFYTGEAMHRDGELRVEPLLWAAPAPNSALLLSKFLASALLALALVALTSLAACALQLLRGHAPVEPSAYLLVGVVLLAPTILFAAAAAVALNVLLRDKHLAYAASIVSALSLYYLYGRGYNHPLYNPALYGLWRYEDLASQGDAHARLLLHRPYCLALATLLLATAHLCFTRRQTRARAGKRKLAGKAWPFLLAAASLALAVALGYAVASAS